MMMKITSTGIGFALMFVFLHSHAQLNDVMSTLKSFTADTSAGWKKGTSILLNTSQTSLTNWASGGRNSLSLTGMVTSFLNYRKEHINWDNAYELGYGIMNQGDGNRFIKTEDRIDFSSKYGYRIFKSGYYAALITLRTQLTKGYNYPNDSVPISRFMAPGYFVGAIGLDFKPNNFLSAFVSPMTSKITMVLYKALLDSGAFGVDRGRNTRSEMGGYIRITYKKDITEDVAFDLKLDLFSNYLEKPENIDVNWQMRLTLKASKIITASISTHLVYDDDIILEIDTDKDGIIDQRGPRIQFKELFSLGIAFDFKKRE